MKVLSLSLCLLSTDFLMKSEETERDKTPSLFPASLKLAAGASGAGGRTRWANLSFDWLPVGGSPALKAGPRGQSKERWPSPWDEEFTASPFPPSFLPSGPP